MRIRLLSACTLIENYNAAKPKPTDAFRGSEMLLKGPKKCAPLG